MTTEEIYEKIELGRKLEKLHNSKQSIERIIKEVENTNREIFVQCGDWGSYLRGINRRKVIELLKESLEKVNKEIDELR